MLVVFLAQNTLLPALKEHHVLVWSGNMTVVVYIYHQGGLRSHPLYRINRRLLFLAQNMLICADMLFRGNEAPREWTLHPQTVLKIWSVFRKAEVDLLASEDNSHCQTYSSIQRDAQAHHWPSARLYTFPTLFFF